MTVEACNCSICEKTGFQHLIVPADNFTLLQGRDQLTEYTFNTGTAKHLFCRACGIKSFYIPRSNPDGVSLNMRCMMPEQFKKISVQVFDGQNWEENAARLTALSQPNG